MQGHWAEEGGDGLTLLVLLGSSKFRKSEALKSVSHYWCSWVAAGNFSESEVLEMELQLRTLEKAEHMV